MKIRNSFITNSSSSSFIAVFAKIIDEDKAEKIINQYNLKDYILSSKELRKSDASKFSREWCGAELLSEEDLEDLKEETKWNDLFVFWHDYEDLDDEYLHYNNLDYDDIDLSDFGHKKQQIFNDIDSDNGFEVISSFIGAGYNG